jgi:hypothetical protein
LRRGPERRFHHFVRHPAEEERIGPAKVLDRMAMQIFVRTNRTVVAASVQGDVDRISKRSH